MYFAEPARCIGSLWCRLPSSGRHAPCRGVGPLARPRVRLSLWLRQQRQPRSSARFSAVAYFVAASSLGIRRRVGIKRIALFALFTIFDLPTHMGIKLTVITSCVSIDHNI